MNSLKGIRKNVLVFGFVSLLNDISAHIAMPLLPIYLTTVLGADKSIIGLIEGIAESTSSLLKAASGWVSDKTHKRKRFVSAGYITGAVARFLLAFTTMWQHVLALRFFDRVGKGLRTAPRDAIIASSSQEKTRGKSFGFHRAMDTLGAVLGPGIAFLLFPLLGYNNLFMLAAIPAFLGVLLVILFVKEKTTIQEIKTKLRKKPLSPKFKKLLLITAFFYLGNFSYAFFVLRAGDFGYAIESVILLYLAYNITSALFAIPAGTLSDRFGRKPLLALSYIIFSLTCLGFAFAGRAWFVLPLFVMYGLFDAIIEPVQRAFVSDLAEEEHRATALGAHHTVIGMVALPSSLIVGVLWQSFGATAAFSFGAILSVIAAVLLLILL
jgi:MFS family permease